MNPRNRLHKLLLGAIGLRRGSRHIRMSCHSHRRSIGQALGGRARPLVFAKLRELRELRHAPASAAARHLANPADFA
jgi:hypothetical protein